MRAIAGVAPLPQVFEIIKRYLSLTGWGNPRVTQPAALFHDAESLGFRIDFYNLEEESQSR